MVRLFTLFYRRSGKIIYKNKSSRLVALLRRSSEREMVAGGQKTGRRAGGTTADAAAMRPVGEGGRR
ncbi:hypothetical protein GCWU000246_00162 [Jonquetella anthropi E3_33 E1]|nr:hypothetical protein GCWU000246_00162 [Jonquetella anthropi E3_33 E1]